MSERSLPPTHPVLAALVASVACLVALFALGALGPIGTTEVGLWLAASTVIVIIVGLRAVRARRRWSSA